MSFQIVNIIGAIADTAFEKMIFVSDFIIMLASAEYCINKSLYNTDYNLLNVRRASLVVVEE